MVRLCQLNNSKFNIFSEKLNVEVQYIVDIDKIGNTKRLSKVKERIGR